MPLKKGIYTGPIPYLMIDRTAFVDELNDRLTVQKVPPALYHTLAGFTASKKSIIF